VLGCNDGKFGLDCTCSSNEIDPGAVCLNGTWTISGDVEINRQIKINTDTVYVMGNFHSESESVLIWAIDGYSMKHGSLKVEKMCNLEGTAVFYIRSPVGEYNISIVEFSPELEHFESLDLKLNSQDDTGCMHPMNATLQTSSNSIILNLQVFDPHCPPALLLKLEYIIAISVGSFVGLILIIGGIILVHKKQNLGGKKTLRDFIEEGYDDSNREELESFLPKN